MLTSLPVAQKEWSKLTPPIQDQFKKKRRESLDNPHVPSAKLWGYESVYKIKLRTTGYHLTYEVMDDEIVVYVLAIGKRDKDAVYRK